MRRKPVVIAMAVLVIAIWAVSVLAAGPKFLDGSNKHNLSSQNTGVTYQAQPGDAYMRDKQVCIFCHTPHNSSPQGALWNRKDPTTVFGRYTSSSLVIRRSGVPSSYGEPNGSSRLCLSCHDGITAEINVLGTLLNGNPIEFPAGKGKISGVAAFDVNKVRLGHHPVSFVYDAAVLAAIQAGGKSTQGYKLPTGDQYVKLQRLQNKDWMQCTTCHDPHQNQTAETAYPPGYAGGRKIAPFWVLGDGNGGGSGNAIADHDTVCLKCHNITKYNNISTAWPWP